MHSADACHNIQTVQDGLNKAKVLKDGSITAVFEKTGKAKIPFSHRQLDKAQTRFVTNQYPCNLFNTFCRAVIVRWVSESMRPFSIVSDEGFIFLMKTGRPSYYIPSASTVSRDVKTVFTKVRGRIAKILQVRIQVSYMTTQDKTDLPNILET